MEQIRKLMDNMGKVIVGKEKVIEKVLVCLLCKGHVLIEDVPGVGKTTMVHSLAKSLDMSFRRIQFTPDLLPSDVTGVSVYNQSCRYTPKKFFAKYIESIQGVYFRINYQR